MVPALDNMNGNKHDNTMSRTKIMKSLTKALYLGLGIANVILFGGAGNLWGGGIPLFPTGVDDAGNRLAGSSVDPHYVVADLSGAHAMVLNDGILNQSVGWVKPANGGKWINYVDSIQTFYGTRKFRTSFDLTGVNLAGLTVTGLWTCDNQGAIYLNGTYTGITNLISGYGSLHPFTITSGFQTGINTLEFRVTMDGTLDGLLLSELGIPPSIATGPATQTVGVGNTATFSVGADGSLPMAYQWYFNGSPISGATGASLAVTNTLAGAVGAYQVAVSNSVSSVMSTAANLWLDELKMYAGVNVYGPPGSNCVVQYVTDLSANPIQWTAITNIVIQNIPEVIIDYTSPGQTKRFYRVWPQP